MKRKIRWIPWSMGKDDYGSKHPTLTGFQEDSPAANGRVEDVVLAGGPSFCRTARLPSGSEPRECDVPDSVASLYV